MQSKHLIVLAILSAYLLINLGIGIYINRKTAGEENFLSSYFVGSRGMGGLVLAMTLVATYTSASSFLGGPGLASTFGLSQSWIAGVQIGATFLTLGVLGKKFALISRRIQGVTISDYLRARYQSGAVVVLCGLALVVFFITQMIGQFIGGATLIQTVTGVPYWAGLLLFGAVVVLYTAAFFYLEISPNRKINNCYLENYSNRLVYLYKKCIILLMIYSKWNKEDYGNE